ncbi:metallophosphoesterase family protein [Aeoliella sp.]|uniref:metallophosphoesterase family protein n=1 Tax=Aeoliella sp. TaxID=2795800 RepID=UPI003CCBD455
MDRRVFLGTVPLSALALRSADAAAAPAEGPLLAGPPVVQHPDARGFSVSFAVSGLATGWVEWGLAPDELDHTALPSRCGLIDASDRSLVVRVEFDEPNSPDQQIYYRVAAQRLAYRNAYELTRSEPEFGAVQRLRLPDPAAESFVLAMVNDTHENAETLSKLHQRLDQLEPDALLWCGDTCNDFDAGDRPELVTLAPVGPQDSGWASRWPLLFAPGNHDVRGQRARELRDCLPGWPNQTELPYCRALRLGPIGLVMLDTGEDKPDHHPVFAGTAAYEPYRQAQTEWLRAALATPEIADAPFKIAACHIPLRGIPGESDGMTLEDFARHSGDAARQWLPLLAEANVRMVLSGHRHDVRIDDPTPEQPVMQVVGGAPAPRWASLTTLQATPERLVLTIEHLDGSEWMRREFSA